MNNLRNLILWIIIALLLVALFNMFQGASTRTSAKSLTFTEFSQDVQDGQVRSVVIQGDQYTGTLNDGQQFSTYVPSNDSEIVQSMLGKKVNVTVKPVDDGMPSLMGIFINWFPMLLLIAVWVFFLRQMQSGGGKAMGFGKSRAKLLTERTGRVTFEDVAGVDEAKEELKEIVDFLRDPQKFQRLGGR
ncbi:MAG TPA: ATP-dependent metallopeptidase FtsH/Yme1/Tma family protein, partial [Rhizomicrobium sp.]|nr:ATP-dependent metallopeptidase FtsH/Yme1/Tma family protein [Rhizomicrobium sp.]